MHGSRIVGRDDHHVDRAPVELTDRQLACPRHRAGVEAGDLVLLQVGDDAEGGGKLVLENAHGRRVHALFFQPDAKLMEVAAGCGEQQRPIPQQRQVVGDVWPRAAAKALL